jgi:hypothetical protein
MTGLGRTVFEGTHIADFEVHVLGVLDNVLGPRRSLVLARLEGGPLEHTGVLAGMSGSPVYIDGRLLGAIAFSFPFGKDPIAGITPIGDMVEAAAATTPRAASTLRPVSFGPGGPRFPLDRDELLQALVRPLPGVLPVGYRGEPLPASVAGLSLSPVALPLVFSGFDPVAFDWARSVFAGLGFVPVLGGGTGAPTAPLPALEPGSAVGVSLIEGDLDLSATGTVTYVEDGRLYAFGHPFYNLGPTQFSMKKAFVHSLLPSLQQSSKIAAAVEPAGTFDQDRSTGVAGRLGPLPRMIPVDVALHTSRGEDRSFRFRVVDDDLLTPTLTFMSLLSVLQAHERTFGTSTIRVEAEVGLAGGSPLRVSDVFTQGQTSQQAAALVAAPLAFLMANGFQEVHVERISLNVSSRETVQNATIQRVWLDRSAPLRPGVVVPLRVQLRTYRGEVLTETMSLEIPDSAPAGSYTLLVSDAATMTAAEQREARQPLVPRDLDQLLRALNRVRHGHHLYARLSRAGEGAIVGGEYLPGLPASVLAVLGPAEQGATVLALRTATVWDGELSTDFAVTGARMLQLTLTR